MIDVRISSRNWVYYSHLICGQDHEKKLGLDFLLVPIQGCNVVWLANMFFLASLRFGKNDQPMYSNKDFAPKGQFFPSHALEKLSTLRRISREMKIFSAAAQFLYIWSKNSHELEEFRFGCHNSQYAYKKRVQGYQNLKKKSQKRKNSSSPVLQLLGGGRLLIWSKHPISNDFTVSNNRTCFPKSKEIIPFTC